MYKKPCKSHELLVVCYMSVRVYVHSLSTQSRKQYRHANNKCIQIRLKTCMYVHHFGIKWNLTT